MASISEQANFLSRVCEILNVPAVQATSLEAGNQLFLSLINSHPNKEEICVRLRSEFSSSPAILNLISNVAIGALAGKRPASNCEGSPKKLRPTNQDILFKTVDNIEFLITAEDMQVLVRHSMFMEGVEHFYANGGSGAILVESSAHDFRWIIQSILNPDEVAKTISTQDAYTLFINSRMYGEEMAYAYTPALIAYIDSLDFSVLTDDEVEVLTQIFEREDHIGLKAVICSRTDIFVLSTHSLESFFKQRFFTSHHLEVLHAVFLGTNLPFKILVLKQLHPDNFEQVADALNLIPELNTSSEVNRAVSRYILQYTLRENSFPITQLSNLTKIDWNELPAVDGCLEKLPAAQITHLHLKNTFFSSKRRNIRNFTALTHLEFCYDSYRCLDNFVLKDVSVFDNDLKALAETCPHLKVLDLSNTRVTDHGIRELVKGCKAIEELNLLGTEVTDKSLLSFAQHCPQLRRLNLEKTYIGVEGLRAFIGRISLESLCIAHVRPSIYTQNVITDEFLDVIGHFPELKFLKLDYLHVTDHALARCFSRLPILQRLELSGFKSEMLKQSLSSLLVNCPSLNFLKLTDFDFSTTSLSSAGASFASLKNLILTRCTFIDRMTSLITRCPHVEELNLCKTPITNNELCLLAAHCPILKTLDLSSQKILSGNGIANLATFSVNLETLIINLSSFDISGEITDFKALTTLFIRNSSASEKSLSSLISHSPKLKHLYFMNSDKMNCLKHLVKCPELETLDLTFTNATNENLHVLEHCKKLKRLILKGTRVYGDCLNVVAKYCSQLEELNLNGILNPVTDDILISLHPSAFQLKHLCLDDASLSSKGLATFISRVGAQLEHLSTDNTQFDDEGMEALKSCNKLDYLSMSKTQVTDAALKEFFRRFPVLSRLFLEHNEKITDAGMRFLAEVPNYSLLYLGIGSTRVTPESFPLLTKKMLFLANVELSEIADDRTDFKCRIWRVY